jgi:hypothetical protein
MFCWRPRQRATAPCRSSADRIRVELLNVGEEFSELALSRMMTGGSLVLEMIRDESLIFLPHLRKAEQSIGVGGSTAMIFG